MTTELRWIPGDINFFCSCFLTTSAGMWMYPPGETTVPTIQFQSIICIHFAHWALELFNQTRFSPRSADGDSSKLVLLDLTGGGVWDLKKYKRTADIALGNKWVTTTNLPRQWCGQRCKPQWSCASIFFPLPQFYYWANDIVQGRQYCVND